MSRANCPRCDETFTSATRAGDHYRIVHPELSGYNRTAPTLYEVGEEVILTAQRGALWAYSGSSEVLAATEEQEVDLPKIGSRWKVTRVRNEVFLADYHSGPQYLLTSVAPAGQPLGFWVDQDSLGKHPPVTEDDIEAAIASINQVLRPEEGL